MSCGEQQMLIMLVWQWKMFFWPEQQHQRVQITKLFYGGNTWITLNGKEEEIVKWGVK